MPVSEQIKLGSGAYGPSGSRAEPWPSFLVTLRPVLRAHAELVIQERHVIRHLVHPYAERAANAVSGVAVDAEQDRLPGAASPLERRDHFARVRRVYSSVVLAGCHENRRVIGTRHHL